MSTLTTPTNREVVPVDELRTGDVLFTNGPDLFIERIEDKPKTRILHVEDTFGGIFEDAVTMRRTTRVYIRSRKAYEVQALVDAARPCINDSLIVTSIEEGREQAAKWFAAADDPAPRPGGRAVDWIEIVEGEYPGPDGDGFEYLPDGEVIRIERED